MIYTMLHVGQLRQQLYAGGSSVPQNPGVYRWWFPKEVAHKLLSLLPAGAIQANRIQKLQIEGTEHWLLYFGIAGNLLQRIKWHACQHHSVSAVKSGYLSTLRSTVGALLQIDASQAENSVNNALDLCYWEYCPTATRTQAENMEAQELATNYYPLNIQKNRVVGKLAIKEIKRLRKKHKK